MRDHSTGLSDGVFGLVHYRVRSILGVGHNDCLLWSNSNNGQDEQATKQVGEHQEFHDSE